MSGWAGKLSREKAMKFVIMTRMKMAYSLLNVSVL
jgi:hypothetical protein